jgi:hypothetical protein
MDNPSIRQGAIRVVAETLTLEWVQGRRGAVVEQLEHMSGLNAAATVAIMCAAFEARRPGEVAIFARCLLEMDATLRGGFVGAEDVEGGT